MAGERMDVILIVDDNLRDLQILGDILRAEGYHIAVSKSGYNAVQFAEKEHPDLILLDIIMPEHTGTTPLNVFISSL